MDIMSQTDFSCANSVTSANPTLITTATTQPTSSVQSLGSSMTTYYHYGDDGLVYASTKQPNSLAAHEDVVGAYLSQRARPCPTYTGPGAHHSQGSKSETYVEQLGDHVSHEGSEEDWPGRNYDSYNCMARSLPDPASTIGYAGWAIYSNQDRPYPNPEHIRHLHSLHSLLSYLQPERKLNSLSGPTMDIVVQDTNAVLVHAVPKKLLVLFLGRKVVSRYIRTVEREDTENWSGRATRQILSLPHGLTSRVAVQILVSWMTQACQYHTMGVMPSIQIPINAFAACSLAQTMALLGLHKDALRLDTTISEQHFQRPILATELEAMWRCMRQDNRYIYAVIKAVGQRIQAYNKGNAKYSHRDNQIFALLDKYPELNARVHDLELNERHRPEFGVQWMQDLSKHPSSYAEKVFHENNRQQRYTSPHEVHENADATQVEVDVQPDSTHMYEQSNQLPRDNTASSQLLDPQNIW